MKQLYGYWRCKFEGTIMKTNRHLLQLSLPAIIILRLCNNYFKALQFFGSDLLRSAHILFLNADLITCLDRARKRIFHQATTDDYYVKDTVLLSHYPCPYMPLHVGENKVQYIHNMGSLDDLRTRILALTSTLLEQKVLEH